MGRIVTFTILIVLMFIYVRSPDIVDQYSFDGDEAFCSVLVCLQVISCLHAYVFRCLNMIYFSGRIPLNYC